MIKSLFLSGLIVVAIFIMACASQPLIIAAGPRDRLFPFGTYRHSVSVLLKKGTMNGKPEGPTTQQFSGLVDIRKERVKVIATSPFGTTLFRLTQDRDMSEPTMETDLDALKKAAPGIKKFMRPVLALLDFPIRNRELPREIEIPDASDSENSLGGPVHVTLSRYDAGQIPKQAKLKTDAFEITVKVDDYVP